MPNRHNWMSDTDPAAFAKLIEIQRSMTMDQKLAMMWDLSDMLAQLAEENVRRLYPQATEREVFLRTASRRLDRETMIRAYGWDPQEH
jgi:hypothetical protein